MLLTFRAYGLPAPTTEFLFAPPRRFRADYCWPDRSVIVEQEGGLFAGGRRPGTAIGGHSSVQGIQRDMEKGNLAQLAGFIYLRFTPDQLRNGTAIPTIRRALERARPLPPDPHGGSRHD